MRHRNAYNLKRLISGSTVAVLLCACLGIVAGLVGTSRAENTSGATLIAQWKLDASGGSVVQDSIGGNDGAMGGAPGWRPYWGRFDGALYFDGDDDYVDCGSDPIFDLTAAITVSAWINVEAFQNQWQTIVAKGDSAWRLSLMDSERRVHLGVTGGPDYQTIDGNSLIGTDEWHHVCGTYDGQHLRLYLDGESDADPVAYSGGITTNTWPVVIGENPEQTNRHWAGLIDDVRVYDGALTAEEVRNLYREGPIYVDLDAPSDSGNGSSWSDAYRNLQDGLLAATEGARVHVAEGLYRPDIGGGQTPGDRAASFEIGGMIVHGGYAGYGESNPGLRDPNMFQTILSGDLAANDTVLVDPCDMLTDPSRSENSRHIVTVTTSDANSVLDGFIIMGGQADGSDREFPLINNGGGLYCDGGNVSVIGCVFQHNAAVVFDVEYEGCGAAVYCVNGQANLNDCLFTENAAYQGAVFGRAVQMSIEDCDFEDNRGGAVVTQSGSNGAITDSTFVANSDGFGGAVEFNGDGLDIIRCAFLGNIARLNGGAVQLYSCSPSISNSLFSGNQAQHQSGGAIANHNSSPVIINCTFAGNSAQMYGGAIYCLRDSYPVLSNSILWDNTALIGGSQIALGYFGGGSGYPAGASSITVSYSDVQAGKNAVHVDPGCTLGWGIGNINQNPAFFDQDGFDGIAGTADDNLCLLTASPCVNIANNAVVEPDSVDLNGNPRIMDTVVDMGAYERRPAIYVDAHATGTGSGVDWPNAINSLQDALAGAGVGAEILIADGTYLPDHGAGLTAGDRLLSFDIPDGVIIKGGYAGAGASDPELRDPAAYPTVLSGDLLGNDAPGFANYTDNSYRVVTLGFSTSIDGVTITAGHANLDEVCESGAGVYITDGHPTITDCRFYANKATNGGALYIGAGTPQIIGCTFESNLAVTSGAVFNGGSPLFERCVFYKNSAERAAAMSDNGSATIVSCTFTANTSTGLDVNSGAGALFNQGHCTVINCLFNANVASARGGAVWLWQADIDIINCTFFGNMCSVGRDIVCWSGSASLASDVHIVNSAFQRSSNPINKADASIINVQYSNLLGFWAGEGNINASPSFTDTDGPDDTSGTLDDDFHPLAVSALVNAGSNGALPLGFDSDILGDPRITHDIVDMGACEFQGTFSWYVDVVNGSDLNNGMTPETAFASIQKGINSASTGFTVVVYPGVYQEIINFKGKAITVCGVGDAPVIRAPGDYAVNFYTVENARSVFRNFVITDSEIGIFVSGSSPTITNVTIAGNDFGIAAYEGANPQVRDCILWNNAGGDLYHCSATYSCVQSQVSGPGNMSVDPLFADPNTGDYHLKSTRGRYDPLGDVWVLDDVTSPCVDAGDPDVGVEDEPAPHGLRANMGAYGRGLTASLSDRTVPGDVNGDGIVNTLDIALIAENWLESISWAR